MRASRAYSSFIESARVGTDALRANPLRTVLSTTGVIIGVAALVAAFAITDGVEVWSRDMLARESSVQDVAITPITMEVENGRTRLVHNYPVFDMRDADAAGSEVPGVMQYALMLNGTAPIEFLDRRASAQLTLSTAGLAHFGGMDVGFGRYFNDAEVARSAPVVVLGNRLARELADSRDPLWLIGRSVRLGGEQREVIGVLSPPTGGPEPDLVAFAPIRGNISLLSPGSSPRVATLRLKAHSIEAVDSLKTRTMDWLAEHYGLQASKLRIETGSQRLENTKQALLLSKLLLGLLAALMLAVGGIGIMNVLLAAVAERTREIGIRKAVGASSRDIHAQFLVESVAVTGAGSAIGFVLGMILAAGGTAIFRMIAHAPVYPQLRLVTAMLAILSAVVVGVVFGTYPARLASRLSPVDAIARE
ncbi:MAG TPA: ABC transporter permease [Gemmatimonadaceae bacterium]|nr:ABC transporter permease [Gemmatimonadaceae bacterium]